MTLFKRSYIISLALSLMLNCNLSFAEAIRQAADLVVMNADIYTSNPAKPVAQSLAVKNGKFIAVGSYDYIKNLIDKKTHIIDAHGNTIIPGLTDSHTHLLLGTELFYGVDLYGIQDRKKWKEMIRKKDSELPKGAWILGGRWEIQDGESLPTKQELDAIVSNRPIVLADSDFHTMWVNSAALKELGITNKTPNPSGGEITRDPKTGELTGLLKENALDLVINSPAYQKALPAKEDLILKVFKHFNSLGITSVHDMWSSGFDIYQNLLNSGKFPMRVWFGLMADISDEKSNPKQFKHYSEIREKMNNLSLNKEENWNQGPQFRFGYIKYFADGVMSTRTAALHEEYSDCRHHYGELIHTPEKMNKLVKLAHDEKFPVAVHAIGDHSVDMVIDAFKNNPSKAKQPDRIEHIELVKMETIPYFAKLNIVASMQPDHAIRPTYTEARLGKKRLKRSFAWQAILTSGAKLVFGSDWPTAIENPMIQLNDAVLREKNGKVWYGENALTFDEALYAYTQEPANIAGWGDKTGSISVGKFADFVILDKKIDKKTPINISNIKVDQTWFAGEKVYQK
ncbi:amidohydrolase (plasmid) [Arsenophonus sp. aPb]|uniref:amidohydrolase n=1 Tax=Arsenophonus sp. aPb TaxID=3041619 RepID=UPI002468F71B|nr:amidohydrolase [Arsenophonus sp. aPb]WGL99892.1 amidohydrolase [Arsenophonus sp. aPb]